MISTVDIITQNNIHSSHKVYAWNTKPK